VVIAISLSIASNAAPGDLDPSFGNAGLVTTSITNVPYYDLARSMKVQADGKIVVSGWILEPMEEGDYITSYFLARYNPDGSLDSSFGNDGKVVGSPFTSAERVGTDIALRADGKIVAIGYQPAIASGFGFALNRYNADGTPDISFGTGGRVVTPFGTGCAGVDHVVVQPDGKILVTGTVSECQNSDAYTIFRYDADGSIDGNFGTNGRVVTQIGTGNSKIGETLLQDDGKILLVGSGNNAVVMVRYRTNGGLDPDFGVNGKAEHSIGLYGSRVMDSVIQPDGKIAATGHGSFGQGLTARVARYNANGSIDTGFAEDGIFSVVGGALYPTETVSIQPDGKILAIGSTYAGGNRFTVARLNADGTPDAGFGTNGIVVTQVHVSGYGITDGLLQSDGKILALGDVGYGDVWLFRLLNPATVSVSGRVTTAGGLGLRNATVILSDSTGARRTATTSSFGQFTVDGLTIGASYIVSVRSKRYRFESLTLLVNTALTEVNFEGLE